MIYHFSLAYLKGMSGGDRCTLEIVRYFAKHGFDNTLITTKACKDTFLGLGLREDEHCRFILIPDYAPSEAGLSILSAYIRRTIAGLRLVGNIDVRDDDILFCHNDFFPNSIVASYAAKKYRTARPLYWYHSPGLWKAYLPSVVKRFDPRLIYHLISFCLFKILMPKRSTILINNIYYLEQVSSCFPRCKVVNIEPYSGSDVSRVYRPTKKYDLVWCGRFQHLKGVEQIVDIVEKVKRSKSDISLAVIGFGEPWEEKLRKKITVNGLKDNITMMGFVDSDEKSFIMMSSKIFLMTSLYESFGQVNIEAMKCGLPVVAYDLPVFEVFRRGMIRVPVGNNVLMTNNIVALLNDKLYYECASSEALRFSRSFSWEKTGQEVVRVLRSDI